ncbi:guanylyl cyclase 1 [Tasmannia lanceolata]|uniref:guanylyl cyclase 1 n=1 Tax=Tasmannia lanceolata TaxID=3420 RepID=UPI004062D0E5
MGEENIPDEYHSHLVEIFPLGVSSFPKKSYDTILPRSHFVEVPHIRQLCNWDCGLACVSMVLKALGIDHCDIHSLGNLCGTTSIWTVDLAYLLHKFSVRFSFLTVTVGANPDFLMETFYKEQFPSDIGRVDRLFAKALEAGISIQCRSISGEEISFLILSGKYVAVALVDKYKLSRSWLEDICVSGCYGGASGYTGHYVVICGYDADTNEFEIRDPASCRKYERVSLECLEDARKSFGTDEDILLISLNRKEGGNKFLL